MLTGQSAAILSCFVSDEKSNEMPKLTQVQTQACTYTNASFHRYIQALTCTGTYKHKKVQTQTYTDPNKSFQRYKQTQTYSGTNTNFLRHKSTRVEYTQTSTGTNTKTKTNQPVLV